MLNKTTHRNLAALLLALLFVGLSVSRTYAHAGLIRTDPPDGTVLDEAPSEMKLWFSESITPEFSSFRLIDINGQEYKFPNIHIDATDSKLVVLTLPDGLEDGVYSLNWSVHSQVDGHVTNGLVVMGIGAGTELGGVPTAVEVETPWMEAVLRWLNFTLLSVVVGGLVVAYIILNKARRRSEIAPQVVQAQQALMQLLIKVTAVAWIVGFLLLIYQAVSLMQNLPEGPTVFSTSWQIISATRWGWFWVARQLLLPIMAVLFLLVVRQPGTIAAKVGGAAATLLALVQLLFVSLNSHAAALSRGALLAVAADWLHFVAVGVWLGSILTMAWVLIPILRRERPLFMPIVKATWGLFGSIALVSVVVIIATGLYSTGQQVATFDTLLTSQYGRGILGKVGLLLLMGAVGLLNAMMLHPGLARPLGWLLRKPAGWTPLQLSALPRMVVVEGSIGLVILFIAGIVTALPTVRGPQYITYYSGAVVDSQAIEVDDMLISLSAKPNLPGSNVVTIRASSFRRPEPASVFSVFARFTYLEEDMGTTTIETEKEVFNRTSLTDLAAPVYRIGGTQFSLPGRWQVEVVVRRDGLEDSVAQFEWIVPTTNEPPPVMVSVEPLLPVLTWLAGGGLILALLLLIITMIRWVSPPNGRNHPPTPPHKRDDRLVLTSEPETAVVMIKPAIEP